MLDHDSGGDYQRPCYLPCEQLLADSDTGNDEASDCARRETALLRAGTTSYPEDGSQVPLATWWLHEPM